MNIFLHLLIAHSVRKAVYEQIGARLNYSGFLYGNILPDISAQYDEIPHFYKKSLAFVIENAQQLKNDSDGGDRFDSFDFSEKAGVITHYLSDFFCFAHSEQYKHSIYRHHFYEFSMLFLFGRGLSHFKKQKTGQTLRFSELEAFIRKNALSYNNGAYLKMLDVYFAINVSCEVTVSLLGEAMRDNGGETFGFQYAAAGILVWEMIWMKVAYFCDTFAPQINGVSTTLEKLNHYAKSKNIETIFLVPDYPGTKMPDENVFRFFSVPLFFYKECRVVIPPIFKAEKLLDSFQPDIIHAYSEFGISLAAIRYAKKRRIPIVSSYTSNFNYYLQYYNMDIFNPYLENYLNWFHNSCKLTFCPSESTRDYLFKKNIKRIGIMRRGVDSTHFNPSFRSEAFRKMAGAREDSVIFTYVGRISPEKDLDILVESIRQVKAGYGGRALFVIVGDGPYLSTLRQELRGDACFAGFLKGERLSEAYASSDVFVFPSTTETFGNVVLEAMCSGLPAIVPDSGGVAEIVTDGRDGFVVPPRDAGSYAAAIQKFLQNPQLTAAMSGRALETARGRTWEHVFGQLFSSYRELLDKETG